MKDNDNEFDLDTVLAHLITHLMAKTDCLLLLYRRRDGAPVTPKDFCAIPSLQRFPEEMVRDAVKALYESDYVGYTEDSTGPKDVRFRITSAGVELARKIELGTAAVEAEITQRN